MTNKTLVRIRVWVRAWIKMYMRTRNYYPRWNLTFGKCNLQDGWMDAALKQGLPRALLNSSTCYIVTNNLPNFGEEDDNTQRRIKGLTTKSWPQALTGIDRWIYDHTMDCIAWISSEIDKY